MTFAAQHAGVCVSCGVRFPERTAIRSAEAGGYEHETCPDPLAVERTPCPRCFTVPAANGECACG